MREAAIDTSRGGEAVGRASALTVTGLCYNAGQRGLINDLTLALPASGISVVMGPNGAGKSLFLRLIHGLIEPDAGQIAWGGRPASPETTRQQALVFQAPVLLRRSVAANVDFVLRARRKPAPDVRDALLGLVGLLHLAKSPARRLSGGERQRLQLARALATDPEVLMMDEPTASLDPASTATIEGLVRRVAEKGVKVIYVTHDVGQARRLADDVVFLAGGRVAEQNTSHRFFEAPVSNEARAYLHGHLMVSENEE